MKRLVFLIALVFIVGNTFSQQQEQLTQYQYNQFAFNPAIAGQKNCLDVKMGYRFQWLGIDGAPQNGFVNANAPLRFGKKKPNAFGPSHGIGGLMRRDAFGPFSNVELHVAYALHIPLARDTRLSFGTSFGFKQFAFDANQISTIYLDNAIPSSNRSIVFPDARIGLWLTTKNEFFGFSVHNLFGNQFKDFGDQSIHHRHFYLTGGKKFKLQKGWTLIPSFFILKTKNTPINLHVSAMFDLEDKISFGVGIRRTDAITAQIRFKLLNFISIGYSFDFIISKLQNNMWQSHEITAGYYSCANYGSTSTTSCATFE